MPATGASPARFFLTQPIYLDNCPKTLSAARSEEHTSELQSLMRISYAVFCLKKKNKKKNKTVDMYTEIYIIHKYTDKKTSTHVNSRDIYRISYRYNSNR